MPSLAAFACSLALQVPSPNAAANEAEALRAEHRTILRQEADRLGRLADRLTSAGDAKAADEVKRALPGPTAVDGAETVTPLPEVVPPATKPAGKSELETIRSESADRLFALATKAVAKTPKHFGLADRCLRQVLQRRTDHAEARRLLGYVPFEGGWATPFAVRETRAGKVLHPTYGWVWKSWVPHLERGELPVRGGAVEGRETWGSAAEADAAHGEWSNGWTIITEHFEVHTNVPLSEAIAFGRRLEAFHDVFASRMADVIGERSPLADRLKNAKKAAEKPADPHVISYYATRAEYAEALRVFPDADANASLGFYFPPRARSKRGRAYFFRDLEAQIDVTATLYHEASHQLLFESGVAAPGESNKNIGNYWVFEGLGTYFETLVPRPDGSIRVGGLSGARNEAARANLSDKGRLVPLAAFVAFDQARFNGGDVFLHYQQASALATFLMDGKGGAYREGFLDYVKSACQGRLRRTAGKSLEDWVGVPYAKLEAELLEFLKADRLEATKANAAR